MEEQMYALLDVFAPADHPYPDEKLNELFEAAVEMAKVEVARPGDDIWIVITADTYSPVMGVGHTMGGAPGMPWFVPPNQVFRMVGENLGQQTRSFPLAVCVTADTKNGKAPDGMSKEEAKAWREQMPDELDEWPEELVKEAVIVSLVANGGRRRVAVVNYTRGEDDVRILGNIDYPDGFENRLVPVLVIAWILGYVKAVAR